MNKISYTTLACPDWDIKKILSVAVENGYDGIDFRGYLRTVDIAQSEYFHGEKLREIAKRIKDSGIEVSCLSSSAKMTNPTPEARENSLNAIRAYADICHALDCRQIRIFGGGVKDIDDPVSNAAETLQKASEIAVDADVDILVETHDSWTNSSFLRSAFVAAGWPEHTAFLWDIHHPFRRNNEKPKDTAENFRGKLLNTHWKDSKLENNGDVKLCLCGEGDVPLVEIKKALDSIDYDGWLTLEWEKYWHPEIEEPEIAIPHFAKFIRGIIW